MKLSISQLADRLGADLVGDGSGQIIAVAALETARETDVSFVKASGGYGGHSASTDGGKHQDAVEKSKAGAIIVGRRIESSSGKCEVTVYIKKRSACECSACLVIIVIYEEVLTLCYSACVI